jgi:TolB-like protein
LPCSLTSRSTRSIACLALVAVAAGLAGAPQAAIAQGARPAVAVLTFDNGGSYGLDSLDFSGIARAIPATLTADLARNPGIVTIDRARAQAVVDQTGAAKSGRLDASAAAKVGKQVGATYVVAGTFVDYYGKVRIDARLIDTGSGTILQVVSTGQRQRSELPQMIADIASQLMSGSRLPAMPAGAPPTGRISTDALVLFGRGVLAQDQGNKTAAADYYQRALKLSPDFAAAKEGLRSVQ